jgi:hypothetical protein
MLRLDMYPVPHPQVAGRVIDGEAVIILSESNLVNVYNPVGSRVWELCDGTRTVDDVIDLIVSEYEVNRERAQADVVAFIEQLLVDRVLEMSEVKSPPVSA